MNRTRSEKQSKASAEVRPSVLDVVLISRNLLASPVARSMSPCWVTPRGTNRANNNIYLEFSKLQFGPSYKVLSRLKVVT